MPLIIVENPLFAPEPPKAFVFFVVAKLGGQYRQLAVGQNYSPVRTFGGTDVVRVIARAVDVLSDESNRAAIAGELAVARRAYVHDGFSPHHRELLPVNRRGIQSVQNILHKRSLLLSRQLPKFPFISACLLHAMGFNTGKYDDGWKTISQPLGLVYHHFSIQYGLVVLDISDLRQVQYGIVAFMTKFVITYDEEDGPPQDWPWEAKPMPDTRERKLMSVHDYLAKFSYKAGNIDAAKAISKLELVPVAYVDALEPAWPEYYDGGDSDSQPSRTDHGAQSRRPSACRVPSLSEMAVAAFVKGLLETDMDFNFSDSGELENTLAFCSMMQHQLVLHSTDLHRYERAPELLSLAYAGEKHLNWAGFDALSPEIIEAALQSPKLQTARSISLCIDRLQGTPQQLIDVLSRAGGSLTELLFHQHPLRRSDEASSVLLELAASPDPEDPEDKGKRPHVLPTLLTQNRKIMVSGVFVSG